MIIVTGGSGFIGSNIVAGLNQIGINKIIIVDDLTEGKKILNISNLDFYDYVDSNDFIENIQTKNYYQNISTIFHQGACSSTTNWNGKYMMQNNYNYSKKILEYSLENKIQLIYASSASVYGLGKNGFKEGFVNEKPLNPYAFSKFQFDQYVRKNIHKSYSQVVGLRYFNVYGQNESHKGEMSSVIFKFRKQLLEQGSIKIFKGSQGFNDGDHERDFIHVDDCVKINLWFIKNKSSGIYNVGTGKTYTFNKIAKLIIDHYGRGNIEYIDFPNQLINSYQGFTKANIGELKKLGYKELFTKIDDGIKKYLNFLDKNLY